MYREETKTASFINAKIQQDHADFGKLKMQTQMDQEDRIEHQNQVAASMMDHFNEKTCKVRDVWKTERDRLNTAIGFLETVRKSAEIDYNEFSNQIVSNDKGIQHLKTSITIAREDIREYSEKIKELDPRLQYYIGLKEQHQQIEANVVELSDQFETLKQKVETESLTARVKEEIDKKNSEIAEIERTIDSTQMKTQSICESNMNMKEENARIAEEIESIKTQTSDANALIKSYEEEKVFILNELAECRRLRGKAAGSNYLLSTKLDVGMDIESLPSWDIRRYIQTLKKDVAELDKSIKEQQQFEDKVNTFGTKDIAPPPRKRIPLINEKTTK